MATIKIELSTEEIASLDALRVVLPIPSISLNTVEKIVHVALSEQEPELTYTITLDDMRNYLAEMELDHRISDEAWAKVVADFPSHNIEIYDCEPLMRELRLSVEKFMEEEDEENVDEDDDDN